MSKARKICKEDDKVNYQNDWSLNLNGDTFGALKSDFNAVLRKTLSNMENKSSEAAELTVKLKIKLEKESVPAGENMPREVVIPKFDHKVSSVMQIKDELTGSLGGNYELVWDGAHGEYVMREIREPQVNFFEGGYERAESYGGDIIDGDFASNEVETPALTGGSRFMLTDKSTGDEGVDLDGYDYDEPDEEEDDE